VQREQTKVKKHEEMGNEASDTEHELEQSQIGTCFFFKNSNRNKLGKEKHGFGNMVMMYLRASPVVLLKFET
jgi:hypothetical protein